VNVKSVSNLDQSLHLDAIPPAAGRNAVSGAGADGESRSPRRRIKK